MAAARAMTALSSAAVVSLKAQGPIVSSSAFDAQFSVKGVLRATAVVKDAGFFKNGCTGRKLQSCMSMVGCKSSKILMQLLSAGMPLPSAATKHLRVAAADGSQIAELETIVTETKPAKSTFEIVQDVIAGQLAVDASLVQPSTKFSDLDADSLDTAEILMSLEDKFSTVIEEDDLTDTINTVQEAVDLIEHVKTK